MTIMRMSSPKPESAYHIAKSPIYDVCVLPTLNEDPVASEACMTGQVRCRSEPVSPAPRPDSWAPRRTASADTRRKPAHRRHSRDVSSIPNQQSKSVLSADADAFLIALNLFREQELDRPGMIHMRNGDSAQRGDHTGSVPAGSQRRCAAKSPSKPPCKSLSGGTRFWANVLRLDQKERQSELKNTKRPEVCSTPSPSTAMETPRSPSSMTGPLRSRSDPGAHPNTTVLDSCAPHKNASCPLNFDVGSGKVDAFDGLETMMYKTLAAQFSFLVVVWYLISGLY